MRRSGAVRWMAALALVLCTVTALPGDDGRRTRRFVRGVRVRRAPANYAYYPDRQRFVAQTAEEWRVLSEHLRIDPELVPDASFERRMVAGVLSSFCGDNAGVDVLGAHVGPGGATIYWRRVEVRHIGCDVSDDCSLFWTLRSFPRTEGPVQFRREPTRRYVIDCR